MQREERKLNYKNPRYNPDPSQLPKQNSNTNNQQYLNPPPNLHKTKNNFRMMTMNAHSLVNPTHFIQTIDLVLVQNEIDVCFVSETI
jgi:hypothetical protein